MPTFDAARFQALRQRRGLRLGAPLRAMPLTASTNDDALAAARDGATHGATFVAEQQTKGRGRRGRSWFAASGESLLCSVVLRLELPLEALPALALATGLALRRSIAARVERARPSAKVLVKWPNDVWVDGKKIAGVLCESQIQSGKPAAIVIGFGVNVMTESFPDALAATATSLALLGAASPREELLADSLAELDERIEQMSRDGVRALSKELSEYDALLGQRLRVLGPEAGGSSADAEGIGAGIDDAGRLLLRAQKTGELICLISGTVELIG